MKKLKICMVLTFLTLLLGVSAIPALVYKHAKKLSYPCREIIFHNQYTDRVNPFVKYETSYAKVSRKLQSYNNVTIYNSNGKKENYKLNHVGGYDPDGHYALIKHKGQYVNYMEYISENKFDNIVRNAD